MEASIPGRRERKKALTRTAIADSAATLFASRGFERVTVQEVAEAADVSRQTVFNHFPAKEDLVFDRADELDRLMVDAVRDRAPGTSLPAAFREMVRGVWGRMGTLPPDQPQAAFWHIVDASPALVAYTHTLAARSAARVAAAIAEEAGAAPDDPRPLMLATALVSAHYILLDTVRRRTAAGAAPADAVAVQLPAVEAALDLLEHGVGAYPGA